MMHDIIGSQWVHLELCLAKLIANRISKVEKVNLNFLGERKLIISISEQRWYSRPSTSLRVRQRRSNGSVDHPVPPRILSGQYRRTLAQHQASQLHRAVGICIQRMADNHCGKFKTTVCLKR